MNAVKTKKNMILHRSSIMLAHGILVVPILPCVRFTLKSEHAVLKVLKAATVLRNYLELLRTTYN